MLAVARLKLGGRIVKISWDTTFARAAALSCRKNALINDPRLQHGHADGKIVGYGFSGNGDNGEFGGKVTIACAVGLGNAIVPSAGTGAYVSAGYVTSGWQTMQGAVVSIGSGDIGYSPPVAVPNFAGVTFPLTQSTAVKKIVVHRDEIVPDTSPTTVQSTAAAVLAIAYDQEAAQAAAIAGQAEQYAINKEMERLQALYSNYQSWLELELIDLSASGFGSESTVGVANLVLPMQYQLT